MGWLFPSVRLRIEKAQLEQQLAAAHLRLAEAIDQREAWRIRAERAIDTLVRRDGGAMPFGRIMSNEKREPTAAQHLLAGLGITEIGEKTKGES